MAVNTWKIIVNTGCPEKFITVIRQFHDSIVSRRLSRTITNSLTNSESPGVAQNYNGCVLLQLAVL